MGAYNIDFRIKGHVKKDEIVEAFEQQQINDAYDNGHRDGYSGDFQTLDKIKFDVLNDGTGDYNQDYEKALNACEKWCYGQAIYTKDNKGNPITLIVAWGAC